MSRKGWSLLLVVLLISLLTLGAWAQEEELTDEEEAKLIREAVEEEASLIWEMLQSQPDPAQAQTQVPSDRLNQGVPDRQEMFVYSLSVWNGSKYEGTFAPTQVDTLYLMAGGPSVINAFLTEVYYWPITREFMANWNEMQELVPGKLRIEQGGREIATLDRIDYGYYMPDAAQDVQRLVIGEEAIEHYEDYQSRFHGFFDAIVVHHEQRREWERTMDAILREVFETGEYKDPSEIPEPPVPPEPPSDYASLHGQAFIVDLPEGRYQISLVDDDGNVLPQSRRTLQVMGPTRTGTELEIISQHRWTFPYETFDEKDVLYSDGTRAFYVKPYQAKEYNRYQLMRMTNLEKPLEGAGTRSAWQWQRFAEYDGEVTLQLLKAGEVIAEVPKEAYYTRLTQGFALGNEFVTYDPEDPFFQGREPNFEAHEVVIDGGGLYALRFVDENGNVLPGSTRIIRSVVDPGARLYAVTLVPFAVGLIIFGWRRSKR